MRGCVSVAVVIPNDRRHRLSHRLGHRLGLGAGVPQLEALSLGCAAEPVLTNPSESLPCRKRIQVEEPETKVGGAGLFSPRRESQLPTSAQQYVRAFGLAARWRGAVPVISTKRAPPCIRRTQAQPRECPGPARPVRWTV